MQHRLVFTLVLLLVFHPLSRALHYACEQNRVSCGCGHTPVTTQSRVVGGDEAVPHSWSMIVSLRYDCRQTGDPATHCCAGTILSASFILTAAHCVEQFDAGVDNSAWLGRVTIAAGIHNQSVAEQTIRTVDRIVVHPERVKGAADFRYDIALLHLSEPIDLATNPLVTRTCRPSRMDNFDQMMQHPSNGTRLIIIGWGRLGTNDPYSDVLQQVVVYAMHHLDRICTNSLYDPTIQFCAGIHEGGQG